MRKKGLAFNKSKLAKKRFIIVLLIKRPKYFEVLAVSSHVHKVSFKTIQNQFLVYRGLGAHCVKSNLNFGLKIFEAMGKNFQYNLIFLTETFRFVANEDSKPSKK